MQEHEFICEYEPGQGGGYNAESTPEQTGEKPQRLETTGESAADALAIDEQEEAEILQDQRAHRRLGRVLVAALTLSFLACLLAPWLSGTLLSAPDQLLPIDFLQILATYRVLVLCVPVICLIVCYAGLRSLTAEISTRPERLLDERQKMLRDQAQRSAFKIVKFASLLIPVGFILPHLPWFNPSSVTPFGLSFQGNVTVYDAGKFPTYVHWVDANSIRDVRWPPAMGSHFLFITQVHNQTGPQVPAASSLELALAGGLLLLTLGLIFSALPMAVLAWKGHA